MYKYNYAHALNTENELWNQVTASVVQELRVERPLFESVFAISVHLMC